MFSLSVSLSFSLFSLLRTVWTYYSWWTDAEYRVRGVPAYGAGGQGHEEVRPTRRGDFKGTVAVVVIDSL